MEYGVDLQGYEHLSKHETRYSHTNPQLTTKEDIENITLADYGLTADTVKAYLFGVEVVDPNTGKPMGDEFYVHSLETAITQAEQKLDIAIFPRIEQEHHDYRSNEFNSHMYTHVYRRPIIQVENLNLELNGRPFRSFPSSWLKVYHLFGHLQISPAPFANNGGGVYNQDALFPAYGFPVLPRGSQYSLTTAPQMIHVEYIAGLLPRENAYTNKPWEMPSTLEKYIVKLALKEIMQVWGRLLIQPGLAGSTLTMDGVTETVNTTQSAKYSAMSAEIDQIDGDIIDLEDSLKTYFGTNSLTTV